MLATGVILLAFTVVTTLALRSAPALAVTAIGMASAPVTLALQVLGGPGLRVSAGIVGSLALLVAGAAVFYLSGTRRARRAPA